MTDKDQQSPLFRGAHAPLAREKHGNKLKKKKKSKLLKTPVDRTLSEEDKGRRASVASVNESVQGLEGDSQDGIGQDVQAAGCSGDGEIGDNPAPSNGWNPALEMELQRLLTLKKESDQLRAIVGDTGASRGSGIAAVGGQLASCILTGCDLPVEPGLCPKDNLPRRACSKEHFRMAQRLASGTEGPKVTATEAHIGTALGTAGLQVQRATLYNYMGQ